MANNVFERREKKYLVSPEQRATVEDAATAGHLAPDAFGRTLITSVYLDTPDRSVIARSLEKPLYKEKLRLRTYGERPSELLLALARDGLQAALGAYGEELLATPAFFELKKKFKGVVYKRRVRLSLPAAWAFAQGASYEAGAATYPLNEEAVGYPVTRGTEAAPEAQPEPNPVLDHQIARELEAALSRHENLQPATAILCYRTAWAPLDTGDSLRITFDDNLQFLDLFSDATRPQPIIAPTTSVMEIKAAAAMPFWLIDTLSGAKIYPQSFSKYGEAAKIMNSSSAIMRAGAAGRCDSGFHRSSVVSQSTRCHRSCEDIPKRTSPRLRPTLQYLKKGA